MADRDFRGEVGPPGRGRNPRHRPVLDEKRRLFKEHIADIQAEQEARDARHWPEGRRCGSPTGTQRAERTGKSAKSCHHRPRAIVIDMSEPIGQSLQSAD